MRICTTRRRVATLLAALAGLAFAATTATAGAAVPDPERNATTPTGWHWWYGQSEAQVKQHYKDDGERIIDLEVQSTSPYRFAVATVRNTGAYARGWYWYYGLTADAVAAPGLKDRSPKEPPSIVGEWVRVGHTKAG